MNSLTQQWNKLDPSIQMLVKGIVLLVILKIIWNAMRSNPVAKIEARQAGMDDRAVTRQGGRTDRTYERQSGRTDRTDSRQSGHTDRTDSRQYGRTDRAYGRQATRVAMVSTVTGFFTDNNPLNIIFRRKRK